MKSTPKTKVQRVNKRSLAMRGNKNAWGNKKLVDTTRIAKILFLHKRKVPLRKIGVEFGISYQRVHQIINKFSSVL